MRKPENKKTSHHDVMPSVANFLSDLWFEGEFRNQPEFLLEIFELLLETDIANDKDIRLKMLSCIKTSRKLAKTLEPFSDKQIEKATNKLLHA